MIAKGNSGEIELDGEIVIVRGKKGFLQPENEKRFPVSRIAGINFKPAGMMKGYLHFETGSTPFGDPAYAAMSADGGVMFGKKDEPAFIQLRKEVERRLATASSDN